MPVFHYQATDLSGRVSSGEVTADDAAAARDQLRAQGLTVTTLHAALDFETSESNAEAMALNGNEQAQLVQQVGDLVAAQVPLSVGLRALAEEVPSSRLNYVLRGMSQDLEAGMSIEQVFERWSASLPSFLTGMIRASSRAGALSNGFVQFANFTRQRAMARRNLGISLMYPCVLGTAGTFLSAFLLVYVVPKFKAIFESFGTELPSVTQLLIEISDFLVGTWFIWVLVPVFAVFVLRALLRNSAAMQVLYYVPFYGPMLRYRGMCEFALLLEMMIRNGVRLPEALRLAGEGVSDPNVADGAFELIQLVNAGMPLSEAVSALPHFNREFAQAVAFGRSESELCESLAMSSERFSSLGTLRLRFLGLASEPLLVCGLGFAVGFVVIALFMPLVKLLNDLS